MAKQTFKKGDSFTRTITAYAGKQFKDNGESILYGLYVNVGGQPTNLKTVTKEMAVEVTTDKDNTMYNWKGVCTADFSTFN